MKRLGDGGAGDGAVGEESVCFQMQPVTEGRFSWAKESPMEGTSRKSKVAGAEGVYPLVNDMDKVPLR